MWVGMGSGGCRTGGERGCGVLGPRGRGANVETLGQQVLHTIGTLGEEHSFTLVKTRFHPDPPLQDAAGASGSETSRSWASSHVDSAANLNLPGSKQNLGKLGARARGVLFARG